MTCNSEFGCRGARELTGVLLAQLGTPDAPTPKALRRYLKQFLWDPRVIEANRVLWWLILNGLILQTRPKRSARLYARIWQEAGSPLLTITRSQSAKLQALFAASTNGDHETVVQFGMRYGNPSLESAIDTLMAAGCTRIVLVPLYPQYAGATTASVLDAVYTHVLRRRWVPTIRVADPYYRHPSVLRSVVSSVREFYKNEARPPERLVLSYHGVPKRYIAAGDPYCCMCVEMTTLLTKQLGLPAGHVVHTFQSRFGKDPWLTPYTDYTIEELARQGVKRIAVACPGFSADCLETLDELGNEASHLFKKLGGEELRLIPCVNDRADFMLALQEIVIDTGGSWFSAASCAAAQPCGNCQQREGISCPAQVWG